MASRKSSGCDKTRFLRFALVVVDVLTPVLRDLLERKVFHRQLYRLVHQKPQLLCRLKKSRHQYRLVQNARNDGYDDFDITLMYLLISNFCSKNESPTHGWWKSIMPSQGEKKLGDDIERIHLMKNEMYSHLPYASISETGFNKNLAVIHGVCERIGNYLNKVYIKKLKKTEICPIDEEMERNFMEKLRNMYERENESRELAIEILNAVHEIKEAFYSATAKVTVEAKDPSKKEPTEVLLKEAEIILNDMVDCIDENTSEEQLEKIFELVENFLNNESNDITRASIQPIFERLSCKIKTCTDQKDKRFDILAKYFVFLMKIKKKYDADIKIDHSCLVLQLTFSSEEGYVLYTKDLERGEIGKEILDLLLFPAYISCFDLKAEDMIISLNDENIYGSGDKKNYEGFLQGIAERNITLTSKEEIRKHKEDVDDLPSGSKKRPPVTSDTLTPPPKKIRRTEMSRELFEEKSSGHKEDVDDFPSGSKIRTPVLSDSLTTPPKKTHKTEMSREFLEVYRGSASDYPIYKRSSQKDAWTSHIMTEVTRSVGHIYVDGDSKGTGFCVGEKYIMTCLHVIEDIIKDSPNFISEERVYIEFGNIDQSTIFHFERTLVYSHNEFDVAVLELRKHDIQFPTSLTQFNATNFLHEEVNLVGYPSNVKLREDSEVNPLIIKPNSNVDKYISKLSEWSMETFMGTDYYVALRKQPRKIIFQKTLDLESCPSGSPGILIRNQKPCVVLMLSGAVPSVYYRDEYNVEPEKRFAFGYSMKDIFDEMQTNENYRKIAAEIFQEWIS